jgi:hypothetical protein
MTLHRSSEYGGILAHIVAENIIALLKAIHGFIGVSMPDLRKLNQAASKGGWNAARPPSRKWRMT